MHQAKRTYRDNAGDRIYLRIYLLVSRRGGGWRSMAAFFGLAGGLLSVPLAMVLWGIGRFIAPIQISSTLNELSNILFLITLPLMAVGACCLDLLENRLPPSTRAS